MTATSVLAIKSLTCATADRKLSAKTDQIS